jgi:hypothetical protein
MCGWLHGECGSRGRWAYCAVQHDFVNGGVGRVCCRRASIYHRAWQALAMHNMCSADVTLDVMRVPCYVLRSLAMMLGE